MAVLIAALLSILAVSVVLYPFVRNRSRFRSTLATEHLAPGQRSRESVYEEIRTLQLERDLGRVDEAEYQDRLRTLRLQAASTMRDEERHSRALDRALEEEVSRAQSGGGLVVAGASCGSCGRPLESDAEACPSCGTYLTQKPEAPHRDNDDDSGS